MENRQLAKIWYTWLDWYDDMMGQKALLAKAFKRLCYTKWAIAFEHWYRRTDLTGCKNPVR